VKALLIVDMQKVSFTAETPRFNREGVVKNINEIAEFFRKKKWPVVFIQHDGTGTNECIPGHKDWELLDDLNVEEVDESISKTANDAFYRSDLEDYLKAWKVDHVYITGCATDFCVESTLQSALAKDYYVTAISDAHTTADRPTLTAKQVIDHYNWVWQGMLPTQGELTVKTTQDILAHDIT
jgi:nicotinamidase-related amidase